MLKNSSTYIPFARKYRPQKFSDLLGQDVLVKTISYCVSNNRLSQSYLLTGIRGIGKTSSARIIAKTVNCSNIIKGEHLAPCNKCKNCESFNNNNHPDIMEIDAASNTSVDDIREIIESAEYRPLIAKVKIFIIDEVHMLSKSAFNALLKIVEEPPKHIIFVFATTEVQKIPLTVISRCQRYNLRRLTFDEIYKLLYNITKKEAIDFEENALKIISVKSQGSARDAVTLLDQSVSYVHNIDKSGIVSTKIVNQMLGILDCKSIIKFVKLIISNDVASSLDLLSELYNQSNNLQYLIEDISDFIAELCKFKMISNYENQLYSDYKKEIFDILIGVSLSRISILWQIFSKGVNEVKESHNDLVAVEMLIIKAIYACNLPAPEEFLHEKDSLSPDNINNPLLEKQKNNITLENKTDIINSSDKCFEFLKYCYNKTEMEIYHLLLNKVEIREFSQCKMIVSANQNLPINIISKIKNLLKDWSKKDWKIITIQQDRIFSLKEKMIKLVKESGDYRTIKNKFPDENISDIILNSSM